MEPFGLAQRIAALEEVALGLSELYGLRTGLDLRQFPALSERVARAANRPVGWHKSVVGEGAFTHEAGIHVDGLLKDPANYQAIDPREVGRSHQLVLGKHSGSHRVIAAYAQLGIFVSRTEAEALLASIRGFVARAKRSPQQQDLAAFYDELTRRGGGEGRCECAAGLGDSGPA